MTFTVTYRDRTGAKREETLESESRSACVTACRAQGISPLAIREGGKVRASAPAGRARREARSRDGQRDSGRKTVAWVALVACVSFATLVLWWWFGGRGTTSLPVRDSPAKPKVPAAIKGPEAPRVPATAQAPVARPPKKPADAAPEPPLKWQEDFITNREMRIKFSVLASAQTNDCGVVTERYRLPNGQYWRRQIDPPPIFENPSDNAIAMALGDRSGAPIPPYPGLYDANLDEAFAKSLSSPIVINEDDKPWLVALKTAVQEAREEIARQIEAGDKAPARRELKKNAPESAQVRAAYEQLLAEEGE